MIDRVIVSDVAGEHYINLQRRTLNACFQHNAGADARFTSSFEPWNYVSKVDSIKRAVSEDFRFILWMDVSFQPVLSLEPIWQYIAEHGWFIPKQGSSVLGAWCTDDALQSYGITRDQAMDIPLCFSGLVGLDMQSSHARLILQRWNRQRCAFAGPHYNRPGDPILPMGNKFTGHCSYDPRVEGHRHDEAALSFVLWSLGLKPSETSFLSMDNPDGYIIGRNFVNENGTYNK